MKLRIGNKKRNSKEVKTSVYWVCFSSSGLWQVHIQVFSCGGNLSWMQLELLFVIFKRLPDWCVPYTEVTTLSSLF